jgi:hypothetical protein
VRRKKIASGFAGASAQPYGTATPGAGIGHYVFNDLLCCKTSCGRRARYSTTGNWGNFIESCQPDVPKPRN